jgi:hypothetical protein
VAEFIAVVRRMASPKRAMLKFHDAAVSAGAGSGRMEVRFMSEWRKPEFVELRMDAEISCYSFLLDDMRAYGSLRKAEAAEHDPPPAADSRPLR